VDKIVNTKCFYGTISEVKHVYMRSYFRCKVVGIIKKIFPFFSVGEICNETAVGAPSGAYIDNVQMTIKLTMC